MTLVETSAQARKRLNRLGVPDATINRFGAALEYGAAGRKNGCGLVDLLEVKCERKPN